MEEIMSNDDLITRWDYFINQTRKNPSFRALTSKAWKRCRDIGLGSNRLRFTFLAQNELQQKIKDNLELINTAKPYLDHLSLSLTGISHMIALSDSEGWIIDYRGNPEDLGGKEAGLCLGASWAEKNIGNNGIGTALATGEPVLIYGIEHYGMVYGSCACIGVPIRSNGQIIGGLDISVPTKYADPSRLHLAVACVNSIESTLSFNRVNHLEQSSEKTLSAVNKLIATSVHDLKNPLTVVRGLAQLGKMTFETNKALDYFERIITQADEMTEMLTVLLNIFTPQKLIQKEIISVINEILRELKPICELQAIDLLLITTSDNINLKIDEPSLKRAIQNVLINAIQLMKNGGLLEVKIEKKLNSMLLSIRDSAGGIPKELHDCLFEPFTTRRDDGTGLGLFMTYHSITNTHNGEIWFETYPGTGTTFFIKIPLVDKGDK